MVKGGQVADIGCRHGESAILMAEKYPNSEFYGFDYPAESIATAKKRAYRTDGRGAVWWDTAFAYVCAKPPIKYFKTE